MTQDEHRKISVLLKKLADTDGLSAPPHIESALRAGFRRQPRRGLALWPLAAAAAVLAAAWLWPVRTVAPPAHPAAIVPVAALPPAVRVEPEIELPMAKPVRSRVVAAPRRGDRAVTGFVPAGVWQMVEPMERGTILRVRVPRSSMTEFGIPVIADRWNETVPVDVMVAEDGSVRAFRLVSNGPQ